MNTQSYILMGLLGCIAAVNMLRTKAQKPSKNRTFGLWFNGIALGLMAIAFILSFIGCW